jgi:hypothetical protein
MCPRCEQVLEAPASGLSMDATDAGGNLVNDSSGTMAANAPDPVGAMSSALGLMAVLILCIPYLGYAGFLFSGAGLLIGLWGLLNPKRTALQRRAADIFTPSSPWQAKGLTHPLVGIGICLFALFLALLPSLLHGLGRYH